MSLTGTPLLVIMTVLALAAPIVGALWLGRRAPRRWWSRICSGLAVALAQLLAIGAIFLWVNRSYDFYSSWSDLLGVNNDRAKISSGGDEPVPTAPGDGRTEVISIDGGRAAGGRHDVLVWLPPQYDEPRYAKTRFPVVMILPGQPSTPQAMFQHFDVGRVAAAEIRAGRSKPFVAVLPPLMTDPPRDTECTDVPHGPQAFGWLADSVVAGIRQQLRVDQRPWTVTGWSTGGFCAAKLVLDRPTGFTAGASLGGYYTPLTDHTTGDLFGGSAAVRDRNSPTWLYRRHGLRGGRLLVVAATQDRESYSETEAFLRVARADPAVASMIITTGGHNYRNYRDNLPAVLDWLDRSG